MCVLRVTGAKFDAENYLRRSALRPYSVFKVGEPRVASRPNGPAHSTSGFRVAVSEAEWSDLPRQISDARAFLERHSGELRELAMLEGIEDMRLDFPIELRIGRSNVVAQFDYFPPELLKLAGDLGVGIELSTYPCSDEDEHADSKGSA
jgi:hypothetical protein